MVETTQNIVQSTALPDWYVNYLTNVMGRAGDASNAPYQAYTGPTVAGLTNDQQDSYNLMRSGILAPEGQYLNQAGGFFNNAGTRDTGAAGAGSYGAAAGYYGQGAGADTAGVSSPFIQQGVGLAGQSAAGSSLSVGNPYLQQSTAGQGLAAAAPFLGQAAQSFPGAAASYMNPYNSAVTDQIAKLGARNLSENLLPQISDQFVRSGQFGSAQQRDVVGRALRDSNESILGQQAQVLQQGYGQAGQLYEQDAARQAQLAGTAGGLGTSQQQILQGAGLGLGNLSSADLSRILQSGSTIGQLGLGQAGVAGTDANRQIAAGQGMLGIGQSQIQASQADATRGIQAGQGIAGLGQDYVNTAMGVSRGLDAAGQEQQGNTQANYTAAQQEFMRQQGYPWQQVGNLSNVIQGLPVNQASTSSVTTNTPNPSTISQLAGLGIGAAGLSQSGLFRARGGAVKGRQVKYQTAHSYGNTPRRGIDFMSEAA